MIIRKSQLLIRTIIVRKQGPRGTRQKKLQNLDSIQSEAGPKDTILLEALKRRFQFEKTHRYLKSSQM
jgi:hypothetical protein